MLNEGDMPVMDRSRRRFLTGAMAGLTGGGNPQHDIRATRQVEMATLGGSWLPCRSSDRGASISGCSCFSDFSQRFIGPVTHLPQVSTSGTSGDGNISSSLTSSATKVSKIARDARNAGRAHRSPGRDAICTLLTAEIQRNTAAPVSLLAPFT